MNLTRLFAYEVFPQKNDENPVAPSGGKIVQSTPLKKTLAQLIRDNRLETQTPIAFTVEDPKAKQRVNVVRESVLNFAFGRGDTVAEGAVPFYGRPIPRSLPWLAPIGEQARGDKI